MTLGLGKYYIVLCYSIFIQGGNYSRGDTNQGGKLFKGGHYILEKGFDRGHYSREYII